MLKSILKIAGATALFAGVHSALASRAAKARAAKILGERGRNGLYRPLYNAVAVATFGALVWYELRQPDRELYRVRGPIAPLMRSLQLLSVIQLARGAWEVGPLRFAGATNAIALLRGDADVPVEPVGQGPAMQSGRLRTGGPFRRHRHPLNFWMLPVIWLMPRMTRNLAAFNAVTTAYLIAGSLHEEKRLMESYGSSYADYRRSVNFFLPGPVRKQLPDASR